MLDRAILLPLLVFSVRIMADIHSCNDVLENSDPKNDFFIGNITSKLVRKREIDPIFVGHPKTQVILKILFAVRNTPTCVQSVYSGKRCRESILIINYLKIAENS